VFRGYSPPARHRMRGAHWAWSVRGLGRRVRKRGAETARRDFPASRYGVDGVPEVRCDL
jgi:hypothetical protein